VRDSDLSSEDIRTWSTKSSSAQPPAALRVVQHSSAEAMAAKVTMFVSLLLEKCSVRFN